MSDFKSQPLREWARAEGYSMNPEVRQNTNGLLYVTFKKKGTPAGEGGLNIYFSKPAAAKVEVGVDVTDLVDDLIVCDTINAAKEVRQKIAFSGESTFIDL